MPAGRPARGLIMVKGAVPGAKGGWVMIKDAVKKPTPENVILPAATKSRADEAARLAEEAAAQAAAEAAEAEAQRQAEEAAAQEAALEEAKADLKGEGEGGGDAGETGAEGDDKK